MNPAAAAPLAAVVIRHQVRAAAQAQYVQWLARIVPVAARFPGHRGVNAVAPASEGEACIITIRFDTAAQAREWLGSPIGLAMTQQAMHMLDVISISI